MPAPSTPLVTVLSELVRSDLAGIGRCTQGSFLLSEAARDRLVPWFRQRAETHWKLALAWEEALRELSPDGLLAAPESAPAWAGAADLLARQLAAEEAQLASALQLLPLVRDRSLDLHGRAQRAMADAGRRIAELHELQGLLAAGEPAAPRPRRSAAEPLVILRDLAGEAAGTTADLEAATRDLQRLAASQRSLSDPEAVAAAAEALAPLLLFFVRHRELPRWFRLWERHGVHVTPVNYYQPIPDTSALPDRLWTSLSALAGIDLRDAAQLDLLTRVFPTFRAEYDAFPIEPQGKPWEYHLGNPSFSGLDAFVLHCLVRHLKPRRFLEVGSGHSTRLAAQAAARNRDTEVVCIEQYPDAVLEAGIPGVTALIKKAVQQVELEEFLRLSDGDILFIDSSHVSKPGSDVNFLFLEVLPRLRPGVVVHVHDVFLPGEYPKDWVVDGMRFWNEQYLLQAFLVGNRLFDVLFANAYMAAYHPEELRATFPLAAAHPTGSFWMRRTATLR